MLFPKTGLLKRVALSRHRSAVLPISSSLVKASPSCFTAFPRVVRASRWRTQLCLETILVLRCFRREQSLHPPLGHVLRSLGEVGPLGTLPFPAVVPSLRTVSAAPEKASHDVSTNRRPYICILTSFFREGRLQPHTWVDVPALLLLFPDSEEVFIRPSGSSLMTPTPLLFLLSLPISLLHSEQFHHLFNKYLFSWCQVAGTGLGPWIPQ